MRAINRDNLPHYVQCVRLHANRLLSTFVSSFLAKWWGVEIGRGCRFIGLPLFRQYPGSVIRIGRKCCFLSTCWSNLVGLSRGCSIATLRDHAHIDIGDNCGFSGTAITATEKVTLGKNVLCGVNVMITDSDHHNVDPDKRMNGTDILSAPVLIEDNAWLGANVIVLKGVHIGRNTVVAAGSVVSRSLPENVIAGGIPAAPIKGIPHE